MAGKKTKWIFMILAIVLVLVGLASAAFFSLRDDAVGIEARDFVFQPNRVSLPLGDASYYPRVVNVGSVTHNFTIEGADVPISGDIGPGRHLLVPNFFTKRGEYKFFCKYHPDSMTGVITVR